MLLPISSQLKSAPAQVDPLSEQGNPLIELARDINMGLDHSKVNSGDFGELTNLLIRAAYCNNVAIIHQLPQLLARSAQLSTFTDRLEKDLFNKKKFRNLTPNQKIILLRWVHMAQAENMKGITRSATTIMQGMDVIPKLAAFSEELAKKETIDAVDDTRETKTILKAIQDKITEKAKERQA